MRPLCITCGQPAGSPPQLNRRPDGQPCQTCRNRVLESLPAALPGRAPVHELRPVRETEETLLLSDLDLAEELGI